MSQNKVICKTCEIIIAMKRGNTTNLFQHLKQHHKKPTFQAFTSVTPYENSDQNSTKKLQTQYHTCKDMVPAYIVCKDGFRRLIQTLDKRYLLSRTHFTQVAIPEMNDKCMAGVEVKCYAMSLAVHYIAIYFLVLISVSFYLLL